MLNALKETIKDPKMEKLLELQKQWDAKVVDLKTTIQNLLDNEKGDFILYLEEDLCQLSFIKNKFYKSLLLNS